MRVQGIMFFLAAFAATGASASSIVALEPSASTPSIVPLADSPVDPSILAVPALSGPAPSILALADTPARDTLDVITLGEPLPAGKLEADAGSQRVTTPMVIRGGEVGSAYASPSSTPRSNSSSGSGSGTNATAGYPQGSQPLLDPNDRGTPAKRRALKRQAERLAQEKAATRQGAREPDASTAPVPLGR